MSLAALFPPPKDQGRLGACVAFATAAAVWFARYKQGLPNLDPSELALYYMARERAGYDTGQDTGLQVRDGVKCADLDGVASADTWKYDVDKFAVKPPKQAYTNAALDEATVYGKVPAADLDSMVASGWPVIFGTNVHESFESAQVEKTGVVPIPEKGEATLGGHCMLFVSTLKDGAGIPGGIPGLLYREVRNSWGRFGAGGYLWYPVGAPATTDMWQITTMSAPNPPTPPQPNPVKDPADLALAEAFSTWKTARGL